MRKQADRQEHHHDRRWHGAFNVLSGLGRNRQPESGGHRVGGGLRRVYGELRDEFGILPPGDVRRAIVALADDTEVVRRLFEYRFKEESALPGTRWAISY